MPCLRRLLGPWAWSSPPPARARAPLLSTLGTAALSGLKLEREKALATLPAINALKKLCCHPDMVGGAGRRKGHE